MINIREYYKACGGIVLGTEQQKINRLDILERSGEWVAESKNDGIWFVLIGDDNSGFTRRGNEKQHGLPSVGNGNIIIAELAECTEKALERKALIGHNFCDVHDIVMYKGQDVRSLDLMQRKSILREWLNSMSREDQKYFLYTEPHLHGFKELYSKEAEGIVLKRKDGLYNSYAWDWIKCKKEQTWDMVVLDYILSTAESKSYAPIAKSIVVGQYLNGVLKPMVKVPVSIDLGLDIVQNFEKYRHEIVEVRGFSRTKTGSIRSPQFMRFRTDKKVNECVF